MPSQSQAVADAVVAVIAGLALDPVPQGVRKRKALTVEDGEALPLVLVTVARAEPPEPVWAGGWVVPYACGVAVAYRGGGKSNENADLRSLHDQLWAALSYAPNLQAVMPAVNTVNPRDLPVFDPGAHGKGVDWAELRLTIEVLEDRP
jgi:hypothetical protein